MTRRMTLPRFYFDVQEGTRFTADEVGLEVDSVDAAEYEAARAAAEMGVISFQTATLVMSLSR
jgi:hypothetical protein